MAPPKRPLKMFGATSEDARWFIAQFGNPDPLGGFKEVSSSGGIRVYKSESQSASVTLYKASSTGYYTLSQDGADVPCPNGASPEFDLFASVINAGVAPGMPPASISPTGETTTLGEMRDLRLSTDIKVGRQWATAGSQSCNHNAVNALFAVVLRNNTTDPPQALYYQLSLYEYCASGPGAAACDQNRDKSFFWWSGEYDKDAAGHPVRERFGVRDSLGSYGAPRPTPGARQAIHIDLKPRLQAILASGPGNIDKNPSHWTVAGPYVGQSLFGKAGMETSWYSFDLAIGH